MDTLLSYFDVHPLQYKFLIPPFLAHDEFLRLVADGVFPTFKGMARVWPFPVCPPSLFAHPIILSNRFLFSFPFPHSAILFFLLIPPRFFYLHHCHDLLLVRHRLLSSPHAMPFLCLNSNDIPSSTTQRLISRYTVRNSSQLDTIFPTLLRHQAISYLCHGHQVPGDRTSPKERADLPAIYINAKEEVGSWWYTYDGHPFFFSAPVFVMTRILVITPLLNRLSYPSMIDIERNGHGVF